MFFPPQRIAFGNVTPFIAAGTISFKTSEVACPSCFKVPNKYSSFPTCLKYTSASSNPLLFINPKAGFVKFPSASTDIFLEGPFSSSSRSLCLSLIWFITKVSLLGVPYFSIFLNSTLFSFNAFSKFSFICVSVDSTNLDGNSSTPTSSKK